jgi:hypothetical protein
MLMMEELAADY